MEEGEDFQPVVGWKCCHRLSWVVWGRVCRGEAVSALVLRGVLLRCTEEELWRARTWVCKKGKEEMGSSGHGRWLDDEVAVLTERKGKRVIVHARVEADGGCRPWKRLAPGVLRGRGGQLRGRLGGWRRSGGSGVDGGRTTMALRVLVALDDRDRRGKEHSMG